MLFQKEYSGSDEQNCDKPLKRKILTKKTYCKKKGDYISETGKWSGIAQVKVLEYCHP